jgi:hypothetical protein
MSSARSLLAASFASLALAGIVSCSHDLILLDPPELANISLLWKPTTSLSRLQAEPGVIDTTQTAGTKVAVAEFTDARKDPARIAENLEEDKARPVTTKDDVAKFVTEHVRELFSASGVEVVESGGDVTVSAEIRNFFVTETNHYDGLVRLNVTVTRGRDLLWTGIVTGTATRRGRSYRAENYYKTLSDAILNAASLLVHDPGFRKALNPRTLAPGRAAQENPSRPADLPTALEIAAQ